MFPIGLNFNNGILPADTGFSSGMVSTPDTLGIFSSNNMSMSPIDSFCNNMMMTQAQMEKQYFALLVAILNNQNINHTPELSVLDNIRPYDYNKYGKDGDMISKLEPKMQEKTMQLLDYAKQQGLNVSIVSGYRNKEEQKHLQETRHEYAAKNSLHCKGKAIDIKIANGSDSDYKKLGDYAKSIGMRWGGDFKNPAPERWHFDLGWS